MQMFICPQCGQRSEFDPWRESALCKACGYTPPPPGTKPVNELLPAVELSPRGGAVLTCPKCGAKNRTRDASAPGVHCAHCGFVPPELGEYVRKLTERGVAAAKQGDLEGGRGYLLQAQESAYENEQRTTIWTWLAEVTPDLAGKRDYLLRVLEHAPAETVAKGVQRKLKEISATLEAEAQSSREQALPFETEGGGEALGCPQCGGMMHLEVANNSLACAYCGHVQPVDAGRGGGKRPGESSPYGGTAQVKGKGRNKPRGQMVSTPTYRCPVCEAVFMVAEGLFSMTCPHCTAECVIVETISRALALPTGLAPFAFGVSEAAQIFEQWLHKKKGGKRGMGEVTAPIGLFFPVWAFDLKGTVGWRGDMPVGWVLSEFSSGEVKVAMNNVIIPASRKLPVGLAEQIGGLGEDKIRFEQVMAYDAVQLANWPVDVCEVAAADAALVARCMVVDDLRLKLIQALGHKAQLVAPKLHLLTSGLKVQAYRLVLAPLFIVHYSVTEPAGKERPDTVGGVRCRAAISGQTGAVWDEFAPEVEAGDEERPGLLNWLFGRS